MSDQPRQDSLRDSWEITWDLYDEEAVPETTEIEVCDPECRTQRVSNSPDEKSTIVKFGRPYYVGITAFFEPFGMEAF